MRRYFNSRPALVAGVLAAPVFAHAQSSGVDFSTLTGGVSFATVVTAILAIAAVKVLPLVASWGARKVLGMIGR